MTAIDAADHTRPIVAHLVESAERRSGSKMAAYEDVAAVIGKSATWIRKLLGRQPDANVGLHDWLNIAAAYDRLCSRIEAEAQREREKAALLRERLNAVVAGDRVLVGREGDARVLADRPASRR